MQFENVSSKYGAPMGRRESRISPDNIPPFKSLALFRVHLNSGGYDDGGAYWGIESNGERLYCLRGPGVQVFCRAKSRAAAIDKMRINPEFLTKREPCFVADQRFTCQREYYGAAEPGYVLRFCGDWVDVFPDRESARAAALNHPRNWVRG